MQKDVHDKGNSDTTGYGSQKSLAFTVAWMRSVLRKPNSSLKWTATETMWVDVGTKEMDLSHMRITVRRGTWSIRFSPESTKQDSSGMRCEEFPNTGAAIFSSRISAENYIWKI